MPEWSKFDDKMLTCIDKYYYTNIYKGSIYFIGSWGAPRFFIAQALEVARIPVSL